MLRSVVESYLDSLIEREFDAPLLAMLAARGFYDIHFTHGVFEFGKDVIAKRRNLESGAVEQYAIQSKGGNIGLGDWRLIRPQVEEAHDNNLSHPNFDTKLPRVAVLATTGQLVGGASLDAQQLGERISRQGGRFEVWDRQQFSQWLTADPALAIGDHDQSLLSLIGAIGQGVIREQQLELYSRKWLPSAAESAEKVLGVAAIEASVIGNKLRVAGRLDLASYVSLYLLRAAWSGVTLCGQSKRPRVARSAISLFGQYASLLLDQARPLLGTPVALLNAVLDPYSIVTYPVVASRLIEIFGLLALIEEDDPELLSASTGGDSAAAVLSLSEHPGTTRPVSDDFASAIFAPSLVLHAANEGASKSFLGKTAKWLLERYDASQGSLGLGAHGEPEEVVVERILGTDLESTSLARRRSSYIATAVLDAAYSLGHRDLYDALRQNLIAYDVLPIIAKDSSEFLTGRTGPTVQPAAFVHFQDWPEDLEAVVGHQSDLDLPSLDALLIGSAQRNRHSIGALRDLARMN